MKKENVFRRVSKIFPDKTRNREIANLDVLMTSRIFSREKFFSLTLIPAKLQ